MEEKKIYRVDEVAAILGVTPNFVGRLVRSGKIRYYRIGRSPRFDDTQIKEYLDKCERYGKGNGKA